MGSVFRFLPLIALAHAALIFGLAWQRYATFHNQTFDLALYARMAWGLSHGDVWNPILDSNFMHNHMAWVLLPLGLLGRALGTVPVLLGAQALAIAACVWPLARIGERHLGSRGGWIALGLWLAYPNLGHVGTYEMHPGTLALWPLCMALDALDQRRLRALIAWALGVMACRADYALIVAVLGGLLAHARRDDPRARRGGVLLMLGAIAYLGVALVLQRVWPAHGPSSAMLHFGAWGGSPFGVLTALMQQPARVFEHFGAWARLSYVPRVLLPLSLLPLLAPRWLVLALPTCLLNLASHWPSVTQLDSHYLTPALPALIVAAVAGLARLRGRAPGWSRLWWVGPLLAHVWIGGWPWSLDFQRAHFQADAGTHDCTRVLEAIAQDASIQAPDALLPHLAQRGMVHRLPPPERGTQHVVLDIAHRRAFAHNEDLLRTVQEPDTRTWLARTDHGVTLATPTLLLLSRGRDPRGGAAARYFAPAAAPNAGDAQGRGGTPDDATVQLTDCLHVVDARVSHGQLHLTLTAHGACPPDLALRLGSEPKPRRVDLLFDGVLSPVHLRAGDVVRSSHPLSPAEVTAITARGLWVGLLRSSGARPVPSDPIAAKVPVLASH